MKRLPSISGASPLVRQVAASASTSSTMTSTRVPTLAASFAALIACALAMNRCQRSSFTGSGTWSGSALARAPATFSYLKQPTRSSCAPPRASRAGAANSASVSPG